jgi:4-diphosphocytidyl-2-C-methyl-D-erythritol kinase
MSDWDLNTSWPAPAKLNLFLHITGQRADGYHLLQTVFQFLDFGDRLCFQLRDDAQVRRVSDLPGVAEEADLVVRAARLLQQSCKPERGVDIEVDKRLPMGGGLGGGSSDAATTLVALNHLWQCGLDNSALIELGLSLGADVPVFIQGQAAWAEGVGEELTAVDLPESWFVVLCPPITVSTAEVFSSPQLRRDCPPITIRDFLAGGDIQNVCEPLVRARYPEVDEALHDLEAFASARMTGTGACVYAAFGEETTARQAYEALADKWSGFVARGMNISPLRQVSDNWAVAKR